MPTQHERGIVLTTCMYVVLGCVITVLFLQGWVYQWLQLISLWADKWPASWNLFWPHWEPASISTWTHCPVLHSFNESCSCSAQQNVSDCPKSTHSLLWYQSSWWGKACTGRVHNCCMMSKQSGNCCVCSCTPPGRVLNRFSKDTGFVDDLLPFSFCEFMQVRRMNPIVRDQEMIECDDKGKKKMEELIF